ncbi:hypothetical protein DDE74_22205 [Streptomyces lydicus]|uniref:TfuA-like core domain-containing protein n=1 Tax=Streptomyces lydicus TaxID=47763 RepID=A0A3Q9K6Z1_9ACTN|nr:TfuA-like protein [Streptomyces lydicus]AZS73297.1 hypothetical protein DDE74_22205 [Streptomyces lydicus]
MTTHVFVGPTVPADDVRRAAPTAVVHGPVRHGDLLALSTGPRDTVLIVDGVFHQSAPVRHKEILDVLARGTRVVGASSMGALRAAELWPYGMEGVGLVFGMYARGDLEADDEVAVSHLPSGDHRQFTVPLVNLRWTVANAVAEEVLSAEAGDALLDRARALHYTERNWPALVHATREPAPSSTDAAVRLREFAERHPELSDLKRRDALVALSHCAHPRRPAVSPSTPAWLSPRTMYLARWCGLFRPATPGRHPAGVSELDVLRFQQLYAPDFPARYRRFALARIAGEHRAPDDRDPAHAAISAAAERGIAAELLPHEAWEYWLTPEERRSSSPEGRLLTVLVRSFRAAPGAAPFHDAPDALRGPDDAWAASADAVAAAGRLNEQMARTGIHRTPGHLPHSVVRRHLAEVWQGSGSGHLEATARDRGFLALTEAEEAARHFVLLHRARPAAYRFTAL